MSSINNNHTFSRHNFNALSYSFYCTLSPLDTGELRSPSRVITHSSDRYLLIVVLEQVTLLGFTNSPLILCLPY